MMILYDVLIADGGRSEDVPGLAWRDGARPCVGYFHVVVPAATRDIRRPAVVGRDKDALYSCTARRPHIAGDYQPDIGALEVLVGLVSRNIVVSTFDRSETKARLVRLHNARPVVWNGKAIVAVRIGHI